MTDTEVRDAAGMIIEHGKITKIKGDIVELTKAESLDDHMEITMKLVLNGGVYNVTTKLGSDDEEEKSHGTDTAFVTRGLELYGPDAKCLSKEHYEKIVAAEQTVNKWDLPGVDDLGDIKKAPREITKTMLEAVTRIAMYRSTLDVAFKFEQEIWDRSKPDLGKWGSMDRPAFMMALAYYAFGYTEAEVDDGTVCRIVKLLRSFWSFMSKDLQNAITKIKKKAIKAK